MLPICAAYGSCSRLCLTAPALGAIGTLLGSDHHLTDMYAAFGTGNLTRVHTHVALLLLSVSLTTRQDHVRVQHHQLLTLIQPYPNSPKAACALACKMYRTPMDDIWIWRISEQQHGLVASTMTDSSSMHGKCAHVAIVPADPSASSCVNGTLFNDLSDQFGTRLCTLPILLIPLRAPVCTANQNSHTS